MSGSEQGLGVLRPEPSTRCEQPAQRCALMAAVPHAPSSTARPTRRPEKGRRWRVRDDEAKQVRGGDDSDEPPALDDRQTTGVRVSQEGRGPSHGRGRGHVSGVAMHEIPDAPSHAVTHPAVGPAQVGPREHADDPSVVDHDKVTDAEHSHSLPRIGSFLQWSGRDRRRFHDVTHSHADGRSKGHADAVERQVDWFLIESLSQWAVVPCGHGR